MCRQIRISCAKIHVISEQILSFINKSKQSTYPIGKEERSRPRGRERQERRKEGERGRRNKKKRERETDRAPSSSREEAGGGLRSQTEASPSRRPEITRAAARARGKFVRQLFILKYARAGMHLGHGKCVGLLREETGGGGNSRCERDVCACMCACRRGIRKRRDRGRRRAASLPFTKFSSSYVRVRRFSTSFWRERGRQKRKKNSYFTDA